jgi:hypothetical protein
MNEIPVEFHLAPFSGSRPTSQWPPAIQISVLNRWPTCPGMQAQQLDSIHFPRKSYRIRISTERVRSDEKLAALEKTLIAATWQPVADGFRTIRLQQIGPMNEWTDCHTLHAS